MFVTSEDDIVCFEIVSVEKKQPRVVSISSSRGTWYYAKVNRIINSLV